MCDSCATHGPRSSEHLFCRVRLDQLRRLLRDIQNAGRPGGAAAK